MRHGFTIHRVTEPGTYGSTMSPPLRDHLCWSASLVRRRVRRACRSGLERVAIDDIQTGDTLVVRHIGHGRPLRQAMAELWRDGLAGWPEHHCDGGQM